MDDESSALSPSNDLKVAALSDDDTSDSWHFFTQIAKTGPKVVLEDGSTTRLVAIFGYRCPEKGWFAAVLHFGPEVLSYQAMLDGSRGRLTLIDPKGQRSINGTWYFVPD